MARYSQPEFIVDSSTSFKQNTAFQDVVHLKDLTYVDSSLYVKGVIVDSMIYEPSSNYYYAKEIDEKLSNLDSSLSIQFDSIESSINRIDASLNDVVDITLIDISEIIDGSLNDIYLKNEQQDASINRIDASLNDVVDITLIDISEIIDGSLFWEAGTGIGSLKTKDASFTDGTNTIVIGANSLSDILYADDLSSVIIGANNSIIGSGSVLIGRDSSMYNPDDDNITNSIMIGSVNNTYSADTITIGHNSYTKGQNTIVIGNDSSVVGTSAIAMGYNNKVKGQDSVILGTDIISNNKSTIAIGKVEDPSGYYAISIGEKSLVNNEYGYGVAIGYSAESLYNEATALGKFSNASGLYSSALGYNAKSRGIGTVVLGPLGPSTEPLHYGDIDYMTYVAALTLARGTEPSTNKGGTLYFNDTSNNFYIHNGTNWGQIVDKAYVDAQINYGSVTAWNGLTESVDGSIGLGGSILSNIEINNNYNGSTLTTRIADANYENYILCDNGRTYFTLTNNNYDQAFIDLDVTSSAPTINIFTDNADGKRVGLYLDGSTGFDSISFQDDVSSKGAVYYADYSDNFTDRSLVDKGYVDNQITQAVSTGAFKYTGTFDGTTDVSTVITAATHTLGTGPFMVSVYEDKIQVTPDISYNTFGDVKIEWEDGSLNANCSYIIIG